MKGGHLQALSLNEVVFFSSMLAYYSVIAIAGDIDSTDCASNRTHNLTQCTHVGPTCANIKGVYVCSCPPGFLASGEHCVRYSRSVDFITVVLWATGGAVLLAAWVFLLKVTLLWKATRGESARNSKLDSSHQLVEERVSQQTFATTIGSVERSASTITTAATPISAHNGQTIANLGDSWVGLAVEPTTENAHGQEQWMKGSPVLHEYELPDAAPLGECSSCTSKLDVTVRCSSSTSLSLGLTNGACISINGGGGVGSSGPGGGTIQHFSAAPEQSHSQDNPAAEDETLVEIDEQDMQSGSWRGSRPGFSQRSSSGRPAPPSAANSASAFRTLQGKRSRSATPATISDSMATVGAGGGLQQRSFHDNKTNRSAATQHKRQFGGSQKLKGVRSEWAWEAREPPPLPPMSSSRNAITTATTQPTAPCRVQNTSSNTSLLTDTSPVSSITIRVVAENSRVPGLLCRCHAACSPGRCPRGQCGSNEPCTCCNSATSTMTTSSAAAGMPALQTMSVPEPAERPVGGYSSLSHYSSSSIRDCGGGSGSGASGSSSSSFGAGADLSAEIAMRDQWRRKLGPSKSFPLSRRSTGCGWSSETESHYASRGASRVDLSTEIAMRDQWRGVKRAMSHPLYTDTDVGGGHLVADDYDVTDQESYVHMSTSASL
eukprot:scpid68116/ scgid32705/ 